MNKCFLILLLVAPLALAQSPSAFTYQGTLLLDEQGVDGQLAFDFSLWDAPLNGTQIGQTVSLTNVEVKLGRFTTELDFGPAAFDGDQRWLEIDIADDGNGGTANLEPRQKITPTPYALRTLTAAPESPKIISNLPAGSSLTISINGLNAGDGLTLAAPLRLQQDFNEATGIYGATTLAAPLRLRRQLGSDPSWRNAFLASQNAIGIVMQLSLPGGIVQWEISGAAVSSWALPVGDDGLPLESLELVFDPLNFQRSVIGNLPATPPPSLGLARGLISGLAPSNSYQLVIDDVGSPDYRIVGDVDERLGQGSSLLLRQNPTANPALVNWFSNRLVQSLQLIVNSPTQGILLSIFDNPSYATEYTLRLADDGLPIEEIEISYRP